MSNTPQFDIATAALEHLELLNDSNQNPLEIAAQFRTLLRSKKVNQNVHSSNNIDYTYMDYITTHATIRRRGCSYNLTDHQSKSLHSSYDISKCQNVDTSVSSNSTDPINLQNYSNRFHYPTINWKQLRKKQYEYKLEKFISTKFKTKNLTLNNLQKNFEDIISIDFQDRSSSPSIRTPSISPINYPQPTYTISRLNSISMNDEDILFPIADCNLIIKHRPKRISHLENFCRPNEFFCSSSSSSHSSIEETIRI
jgi:hypothetical protein